MIIAVDLDRTLCEEIWPNPYENAIPIKENIDKVNELYDGGNFIIIYTARLMDDYLVTEAWLKKHGVKYHHIQCCKIRFDLYIDCDCRRPEEL